MLSQMQNLTADEDNQLRTSVNVVVGENPAQDDDVTEPDEDVSDDTTDSGGEGGPTLPDTGVAAVGGVGLVSSILALLGGTALFNRRKKEK